jgi:hypothetical protein
MREVRAAARREAQERAAHQGIDPIYQVYVRSVSIRCLPYQVSGIYQEQAAHQGIDPIYQVYLLLTSVMSAPQHSWVAAQGCQVDRRQLNH